MIFQTKMVFDNYLTHSFCMWIANYLFPHPKKLKTWENKNVWLRRTGIKIGDGVAIGKGLFCLPMKEQNIEINKHVAIGYNVRRIIGYRELPEKVWHFGDTWYSPHTFEDVSEQN